MGKDVLSIIVTAHHEGRLIKGALESLSAAAEKLSSSGVIYSFFINIDNGNSETVKCIERYAKKMNIKVFQTKYGDPGLVRNFIIHKTDGDFLALIDADDMVTPNWLVNAVERIRREEGEVLIHPEIEVRFNESGVLKVDVRRDSMKDQWLNRLSLFADNRWCSVVVGKRKTFLKYRYSISGHGWGYEDYYFNCTTTNGGVRHLVAHDVTAFLLQKKKSVTTMTHNNHDMLPYIELCKLKKMQCEMKKNGLPKLLSQSRFIELPDCVLDGVRELSKILPGIKQIISKRADYVVSQNGTDEEYLIGTEFCKMIDGKDIRYMSKTVAFVGNLVEMREIERRNKGKKFFALTEEVDNIVLARNIIDYHRYFGWMYDIAKKTVLSRMVVQGHVRRLIINNDATVNEWVEEHERFLRLNDITVEKYF